MKYIFHIMTMFVLSTTVANGALGDFTHKDYSQDLLVEARIAWARQENRLTQLKYEAANLAANRVIEYVVGDTHVASIDANDKTITTYLKDNESVRLSY